MTNEEITTAFIWLSRRYEEITPLTYIKREDQYAFLFDKDNKQLILEKVEEIERCYHNDNCSIHHTDDCDCGLTEKINELKQLLK